MLPFKGALTVSLALPWIESAFPEESRPLDPMGNCRTRRNAAFFIVETSVILLEGNDGDDVFWHNSINAQPSPACAFPTVENAI